jgi:hypothetical protein
MEAVGQRDYSRDASGARRLEKICNGLSGDGNSAIDLNEEIAYDLAADAAAI